MSETANYTGEEVSKPKIIIDMSSIMWTCLLVGKDVDGVPVNHNGREVWINSMMYGYENAVNSIVSCMKEHGNVPQDLILVFEGKDSKQRRCMIDPTYKGRADSRPPEAYIQFNLLKEKLMQTFRDLGSIAVVQDFAEGDDVIAYLAQNSEDDVIVMTNDNDLAVLNGPTQYANVMVRINGEYGRNKYGAFSTKLITLYKTLVGDSSDNVKGVERFGEKAFLRVNARYGDDGCFELLDLIRQGKREDVAKFAVENDCKDLAMIVDQWQNVLKCYQLVLLHPEWVNTIRNQLQWLPGLVKGTEEDERLKGFRLQQRLITADNYSEALAFLKRKLDVTKYVAFDIETSTTAESDDWLEAAKGKAGQVDTLGSYLVGFSITFGANSNFTYYVSVKHKDTNNITMRQAMDMIETCFGKPIVIHNTFFELPVLYNAENEDGSLWRDHWKKYGEEGFIPGILDTKIESSYVNENIKNGLKLRTLTHLGYEQESYEHVTTIDDVQYKMHQLTAEHVFSYGADDATCTAALHNFYKFHMGVEHHYQVYLDVEIDAAYQHAMNFVQGVNYSITRLKELEREDKETYEEAWAVFKAYLTTAQWDGTVAPHYTPQISCAEIKGAYTIYMGLDSAAEGEDEEDPDEGQPEEIVQVQPRDEILSSRVRTPTKLAALLESEGHSVLASLVKDCLAGDPGPLQAAIMERFTGEPKFKSSNKQMCKLLYEVMGLPIRVRGKVTENMRAKGIKEGNPKGDALAIAYALRDAPPELKPVLEAFQRMQISKTKQDLYYNNYPYFIHWKTGRIHSNHNQAAQNTRRATSSAPNETQQPKHPKIEGMAVPFREVVVPHKPNAVVVSMDFKAQELRIIADYSQDENMLACYVGDNPRDMHIITAVGIAQRKEPAAGWSYETFAAALGDREHEKYKFCKEHRALGKKTNFTSEYGAMAPKLASVLMVPENEAQMYLDAREAMFAGAARWKQATIQEAKKIGFVTTKLGARRHLQELLGNRDKWIAAKAERQAVNFRVQSSAAEQTKLAEGRMWRSRIFQDYDARCYGPKHDEVVASVVVDERFYEFIAKMHACMVAPYADMKVPIESDISFGPNWGIQIECGPKPTREALDEGLRQLKELA